MAQADFKIQTKEDIETYRPDCVKSLSIPEELVNKYKKFDFPADDKTKCYISCILKKMGLFNETTGFNVDNAVKQLGQGKNETEVRAAVVKCADKNEQKSSACEWAYRGFTCFKTAHLELVQSSLKKN